MTAKHRSLIELNLAVLLWGGTALFAKWIALPAFQISAVRSLVAAVILLGTVRVRGISLATRNRSDFWLLSLQGALLAVHWVTFFRAIQVATVAVGILSLHTYPVITALVEPIVFREKRRPADLVVAAVVVAGAAILVPDFTLASGITQGVLWGVLSAFFFTARNLFSRWLVTRYSGLQIMFYQFLVCGLVLLPFLRAWGQALDRRAAWQLLILGIVFTALPQTLFTNSLRHLTTKTVSVIATALPVYGAILAALLLGEIPTLRTCLGGAVILGAVLYETWQAVR